MRQVQPQEMIVDQPQHHVTCKLGGFLDQLSDLAGCELVQLVPIVHCAAHVRVRLAGGQKKKKTAQVEKHGQVEMQKRSKRSMSCLKKVTIATTDLVGGESKRDGGNAREGEEGVRSTIHADVLQTGNHKEKLVRLQFSSTFSKICAQKTTQKNTDRPQLTHLHVCFPVAPRILREETRVDVWNIHLEEGVMN